MQLSFPLTSGPPLESKAPVAPEPIPEGQLNLFGGPARQLRNIAELLQEGSFAEASALAEQLSARLADAATWQKLIDGWRHRIEQCSCIEEQADLAADAAALAATGEGGATLRAALLMGLHLQIARSAVPGALIRDRPAGWHYLLAGKIEDARASLAATIAQGQKEGLCCVLLGNLALSEGSSAVARSWYQQGFLRDPSGVPIDQIADPAIPEMLDDANELELSPPAAWVPLVGQARGLFGVVREKSVEPNVERFQALLPDARAGSTQARRELKALTPALFALLRDEGKL